MQVLNPAPRPRMRTVCRFMLCRVTPEATGASQTVRIWRKVSVTRLVGSAVPTVKGQKTAHQGTARKDGQSTKREDRTCARKHLDVTTWALAVLSLHHAVFRPRAVIKIKEPGTGRNMARWCPRSRARLARGARTRAGVRQCRPRVQRLP